MADSGDGSENPAGAAGSWCTSNMTPPAGTDMDLLLNWLEAEVKNRLCILDGKLDRLAGVVNNCSTPLPEPRPKNGQVPEGSPRPWKHKRPDPVQVDGPASPKHLHAPEHFDSSAQEGRGVFNSEGMGSPLSESSIDSRRQDLGIGGERGHHLSRNSRSSESSHVSAVSNGPDWQMKVWSIMHDQDFSPAARCYTVCMRYLVWASVIVTLAQTVKPPPLSGLSAAVLETIFDSVFLAEIALRFIVCPARGFFLCNTYNLIDMAAAVPLVLRMSIGFIVDESGEEGGSPICIILLYVVPVIRILKNLRTFQQFRLLLSAFVLAFEALPVLLFILVVIVLSCSSLVYLLEPRSNIQSLPKALYFIIITMTTVGYGDVYPSTAGSHVVMCFTAVIGLLYMAMPIGIIGSAFTETWKARDRILLIKRTRENLFQWGYTAHDIPILFQLFDLDGDGGLSLREFQKMMRRMRVGLRDDRILKLFRSIDTDGGGTIDAREFMRTCFPETFAEMYEDSDVAPRTTAAKLKTYMQAAMRPRILVRSPEMRGRSRRRGSIGGFPEGPEAPPLAEEIHDCGTPTSPGAEGAPSADARTLRSI